eukprot:8555983-Prorocentrum_lima.AAC.1
MGGKIHQQSCGNTSRSMREHGAKVEINPPSGTCHGRKTSHAAGPFGCSAGAEVGGTCGKDANNFPCSSGLAVPVSTMVGMETGQAPQQNGTPTKWGRSEPTPKEIQNLKMGGHTGHLLWKW